MFVLPLLKKMGLNMVGGFCVKVAVLCCKINSAWGTSLCLVVAVY